MKLKIFALCAFLLFFVIKTISTEELLYTVEEEQPPETFVGDVFMDAGLAELQFGSQKPFVRFLKVVQHLHINNETGVISTRQRLDREDQALCESRSQGICEMKLDVVVQPQQFFKMIRIKVVVTDINDNSPRFHKNDVIIDVSESSPVGTRLALPLAEDEDGPEFSVRSYRLFSGSDVFKLEGGDEAWGNKPEPKLVTTKSLDREDQERYEASLVAYDGGNPARTGAVRLLIYVSDVNDNAPEFSQRVYSVTIMENIPINSIVTQVEAVDKDSGLNGRVEYAFTPATESQYEHLFTVNETSGYISIKGSIDYERHTTFSLHVVARDQGPSNPLSSTASVVIHVTDVNDNPPDISVTTLSSNLGVAEVSEDADLGTFVAHVSVTDDDSGPNGKFTCHLNDSSFALKARFLGEFQIVTDAILDRERNQRHTILLTCVDFGMDPQTSMAYIVVNIIDENDNDPTFGSESYEAEVIENNFAGMNILSVEAVDGDEGENSRVSYAIEPHQVSKLFSVGEVSGMITANVPIDRERHGEVVRFWVVARDNGKPQRSSSSSVVVRVVDVNDERPMFSQGSYSFAIHENQPGGSEVGTVAAHDSDSSEFGDVTYSLDSDVFEIQAKTGKIVTLTQLDREEVSAYHVIVVARDGGVPPLSSSASVTIYVSDENDNSPVFLYPLHPNVSLQISTLTPSEHVICRIKAHDQDSGKNGKVHFYMRNKTLESFFSLDSELGTISVSRDLKDKDGTIHTFELVAQDEGFPPRTSHSRLSIVVNRSVPFVWKARPHDESDMNLTLILIIAPVSGVVVTALIAAIVVLCCQERHRTSSKYNCRLETLRLQQAQVAKHVSHTQLIKVKDDISRPKNFVMEDALNECAMSWNAKPEVQHHKDSNMKFEGNPCNTYISCPFKSSSRRQNPCRSPQSSTKKSGRQCCVDGESLKSDYNSNTDSGHGPSEEGESGHRCQEQHQNACKPKPTHAKQSFSSLNCLDSYYPTNGSESCHSYSTHANQMFTFQGAPRNTPDLILDNPYSTESVPYSAAHASYHNSNFAYKPQNICLSSESQRRLLDVEEELSDQIPPAKVNSNFIPASDDRTKMPSTPNGSTRGQQVRNDDIINADDLCNEIDHLFFGEPQPSKWKEMSH